MQNWREPFAENGFIHAPQWTADRADDESGFAEDSRFLKLSLRADEGGGRINHSHLVPLRWGKIFREITSSIVLRSVFQGISFEEFGFFPERKPGSSATRRNVRKIVKTYLYDIQTKPRRTFFNRESNQLLTANIVLFFREENSIPAETSPWFYVKLIIVLNTWTFKTVWEKRRKNNVYRWRYGRNEWIQALWDLMYECFFHEKFCIFISLLVHLDSHWVLCKLWLYIVHKFSFKNFKIWKQLLLELPIVCRNTSYKCTMARYYLQLSVIIQWTIKSMKIMELAKKKKKATKHQSSPIHYNEHRISVVEIERRRKQRLSSVFE